MAILDTTGWRARKQVAEAETDSITVSREDLRRVVHCFWDREVEDFVIRDQAGRENHVLRALVGLDNVLEGATATAEDYVEGMDPDEWDEVEMVEHVRVCLDHLQSVEDLCCYFDNGHPYPPAMGELRDANRRAMNILCDASEPDVCGPGGRVARAFARGVVGGGFASRPKRRKRLR